MTTVTFIVTDFDLHRTLLLLLTLKSMATDHFRNNLIRYEMKAYPIGHYPAKCQQAAGIMHMIMNNLDKRVCLHHLKRFRSYFRNYLSKASN
jgi:hypothetical protein